MSIRKLEEEMQSPEVAELEAQADRTIAELQDSAPRELRYDPPTELRYNSKPDDPEPAVRVLDYKP